MQSWLSQARGGDRSGRTTRNPRAIGIADLGLGGACGAGPRLGQVEPATRSPGPHGPDHRRLGTRSAAASRGPRSGPRRTRRRSRREQPRGQGLVGPRVPAGARPPIPRVHPARAVTRQAPVGVQHGLVQRGAVGRGRGPRGDHPPSSPGRVVRRASRPLGADRPPTHRRPFTGGGAIGRPVASMRAAIASSVSADHSSPFRQA